jgi:hypothetical protein
VVAAEDDWVVDERNAFLDICFYPLDSSYDFMKQYHARRSPDCLLGHPFHTTHSSPHLLTLIYCAYQYTPIHNPLHLHSLLFSSLLLNLSTSYPNSPFQIYILLFSYFCSHSINHYTGRWILSKEWSGLFIKCILYIPVLHKQGEAHCYGTNA